MNNTGVYFWKKSMTQEELNALLLNAAKWGIASDMRSALDDKASVDCRDVETQNTPLHYVVTHRGVWVTGIVRELIRRGADVNAEDKDHFTVWEKFALNCHEESLKPVKRAVATTLLRAVAITKKGVGNKWLTLVKKESMKAELVALVNDICGSNTNGVICVQKGKPVVQRTSEPKQNQ